MIRIVTVVVLFCSLFATSLAGQNIQDPESVKEFLKDQFKNSEVYILETRKGFSLSLKVVIQQPLDHADPSKGTFGQHVLMDLRDADRPTVLVTEGYQLYPGEYELTRMLNANQVQVEYRFYGESRPEHINWMDLTNEQAVKDYHLIVSRMKEWLDKKWISTGISKGGETVMIYKSRYPDDMDAAVTYVAPMIIGQEDPRTDEHLRTVGSKECRDKITSFQRSVLKERDSVLSYFKAHAREKKMNFTEVPFEEALEYAVLEFPFSFWQWGGDCKEIPDEGSTSKSKFHYLNAIVGVGFYNDSTYDRLLPSYYQHMIELGYYGFDTEPVKDLIRVVHEPTNRRFAPKGIDLSYQPAYMKEVRDFVQYEGHKMIHIYGGYDTWGACAVSPDPSVLSLKKVLKGGSHATRIKHFPKEDQQQVIDSLSSWLHLEIPAVKTGSDK